MEFEESKLVADGISNVKTFLEKYLSIGATYSTKEYLKVDFPFLFHGFFERYVLSKYREYIKELLDENNNMA